MLEYLSDEQVKIIFVLALIAPMIVSAIVYGVVEKIKSKPVVIKRNG